jgi:hypothetical protein
MSSEEAIEGLTILPARGRLVASNPSIGRLGASVFRMYSEVAITVTSLRTSTCIPDHGDFHIRLEPRKRSAMDTMDVLCDSAVRGREPGSQFVH